MKPVFTFLVFALLLACVGWFLPGVLKQKPDFCVSCHITDTKKLHGAKMQAMRATPPQNLASFHHNLKNKSMNCPDCHRGVDFKSSLAVFYFEVKNTFSYFLGSFHEPDKTEVPVNNRVCTGCHAGLVAKAKEPTYHAYPSHEGIKRVLCTGCHKAHSPKTEAEKFLNVSVLLSRCDKCHKNSITSPMIIKSLGLDQNRP
ncbi:hypothetical protein MNBD_NITROSPINAE01-318 [hydrothermal vent metagenome]|uniref:Uncharacterized protein n=1 Tax=hydrothermal vent metagenome TaxID=652676 RepID=A0A3B1BXT5_9ZZZZ